VGLPDEPVHAVKSPLSNPSIKIGVAACTAERRHMKRINVQNKVAVTTEKSFHRLIQITLKTVAYSVSPYLRLLRKEMNNTASQVIHARVNASVKNFFAWVYDCFMIVLLLSAAQDRVAVGADVNELSFSTTKIQHD